MGEADLINRSLQESRTQFDFRRTDADQHLAFGKGPTTAWRQTSAN